MAQTAGMPLREFTAYYQELMTLDYPRLATASQALAARMTAADRVRIVAPGTDLTVSLKGYVALVAAGTHNLPDGEIASTPVRSSMEGTIRFNVPSLHNGFVFRDVALTFKDGQVVEAAANDEKRFWEEISIDNNARYIGEFSLGTNPRANRVVTNTLLDEKMGGSLHMALGCCYQFPGRDNGNYSAIHWDLIQSHLSAFGGGEVWVDGELLRKDGIFVTPDTAALNAENW
jgi:aminopeptidase